MTISYGIFDGHFLGVAWKIVCFKFQYLFWKNEERYSTHSGGEFEPYLARQEAENNIWK